MELHAFYELLSIERLITNARAVCLGNCKGSAVGKSQRLNRLLARTVFEVSSSRIVWRVKCFILRVKCVVVAYIMPTRLMRLEVLPSSSKTIVAF